jgi:hypothetical protein
VSVDHVDALVAGLARVRDESLHGAAASEDARRLFERIVSEPSRSSVPRRVAIAVVVAAALLAAPALALRGEIAHLFTAQEPAPATVAASFDELERGAPAKWSLSGAARLVLEVPTPDGAISVWAAPRPVGFCYAVGTAGRVGFASTCVDREAGVDVWPFSVDRPAEDRVGGPFVLVGFSPDHDARSVLVHFENGRQVKAPLTWVSLPIDAGFFAVSTSKADWADGSERVDVTALDDSGSSLATAGMEVGRPTG